MNTKNLPSVVAAKLRSMLITEALKIAEKYPQYRTYFDDHLLVVAKKELLGRSSKICDAGEVLLASPRLLQFLDEDEQVHISICVWDMKEQQAKYVPYEEVAFVQRKVKLTLELDY